MAGTSEEALVEAFDEAERARLLAPGKVRGELMFSHELIRQTVLSDVSAVKRQRLHLRTARAISRLYSDDPRVARAEISPITCLMRALRRPGKPGALLTIAGDRAFDAAAFDDAVGHFEHALSLISSADQLGRAQLLERLAMALRSVGRWDDALRTMDERWTVTRRSDKSRPSVGWAGQWCTSWCGARLVEGYRSASGRWRHSATRERGQGARAVRARMGAQRQRRLPGSYGHVRPGACTC